MSLLQLLARKVAAMLHQVVLSHPAVAMLVPRAPAKHRSLAVAVQVVKRRGTSLLEGSASSFAFAGTVVASDSSSAAGFVQRFAVVEVLSKTDSEQMTAMSLLAQLVAFSESFSKDPH